MSNDIRSRDGSSFNFVDGLQVNGTDVAVLTDTAPAQENIGASSSVGTSNKSARADHVHAMPGLASTSTGGFMSAGDKAKLDGVQSGAQVNTVTSVAGKTGAVALAVADVAGAAPLTSAAPAAETIGATASVGDATTAARADHVHAMPGIATPSVDGFMSAGDKAKLNAIEGGAQVNTVTSVAGRTGDIVLSVADVSGAAPLASPTLTGTPTAPTAAAGTNNTQIATTAFVTAAADTASPAGMVAHFARSTAPTGWLKANGAAVSRTTYAALFAAIGTTFGSGDGWSTFNLPDLRGEFLRGWDDGRGVDAERNFGSGQVSQNLSHNHGVNDPGHSHIYQTHWGTESTGPISIDDRMPAQNLSTWGATTGISIQSSGGSEARPRNIAMLACIKY